MVRGHKHPSTFSAFVISIVSLFLLSMTLWTFYRKISSHTLLMEILLDYTFFLIPVSLLSLPTIAFTLLTKHHKLSYLIWLFAIQIIASTLLITALVMGTSYKLNYSNETRHLISTIPTQELNFTLTKTDNATIDLIHQKFKCQGILGNKQSNGCLSSIQADVAWHRNIAVALCQLFIVMFFFNASNVATIYTSDHFKMKRSTTTLQ
ncbi:unnamed protein product [Ceutorhynchus assimilis]|uniref:Uncharacterized protein n=1 Tax=Ceutorhynchus assimilis TaxID=467358 RepID=A0A9N9QLS3_9CUCU|nr:unnamed protein product [Ceutorhynchus assimilis]